MIRPIRFGIDTLEVSFAGDLNYEFKLDLGRAKHEAKLSQVPEPLVFNGQRFLVQPVGRGRYGYVLRSEELIVWTTVGKVYPQMLIKFLSEGLVAKGAEGLANQVKEFTGDMGLAPLGVTRMDLALDFQGWGPTWEQMRSVVCPSSFRPVYPNTDAPETFQFGKGDVVLRLYNKTKEIEVHDKERWKRVWGMCEGFDPDQEVWRLEVQLRSNALRDLSCRSLGQALDSQESCFAFGLDWCTPRVQDGSDSNRRRWPILPEWCELRSAVYPKLERIGKVAPAKALLDYEKLPSRFLSVVVTAGATLGEIDYDFLVETLSHDALSVLSKRGQTFMQAVEEKGRKAI